MARTTGIMSIGIMSMMMVMLKYGIREYNPHVNPVVYIPLPGCPEEVQRVNLVTASCKCFQISYSQYYPEIYHGHGFLIGDYIGITLNNKRQ